MTNIAYKYVDGWYVFLGDKAIRGPVRPVYAKGWIDGFRASPIGTTQLNLRLIEVRDGVLRECKRP